MQGPAQLLGRVGSTGKIYFGVRLVHNAHSLIMVMGRR